MKVEIWSDFVCPFCYIGKKNYEQALAQFSQQEQIVTEYKSFELDPNVNPAEKRLTVDSLAEKYGISQEEAKEMTKGVASRAAEVGLTFHFENMLDANTFDSHRIMQYAASLGKAKELAEVLFHAHFTDNKNLSDRAVLTELAATVGLDVADVLANEQQYKAQVKAEEFEAQQLGVRGVPFFVIDRKYAISGAQPVEVFLETMNKAWSERSGGLQAVKAQDSDADSCGPDGCKV